MTLLHGRHQAGLPLFDRRGVGWQPWPSSCKEKRDEHDWQVYVGTVGRNSGNSTCPSRGASDHFLGSGVPNALLHGVVEMSVRGVPTQFTDGQGSFDATWRRRRLGLEKLERVGNSHACGQHCLHPASLASLGRAWGRTLMSWTSRCNREHHSLSDCWARIRRPCWQATASVIGARS